MNEHFKNWKKEQCELMKTFDYHVTENSQDEFHFIKDEMLQISVIFEEKLTIEMKKKFPDTLFVVKDKMHAHYKEGECAYSLYYGTEKEFVRVYVELTNDFKFIIKKFLVKPKQIEIAELFIETIKELPKYRLYVVVGNYTIREN